jgi:hypothetical protein
LCVVVIILILGKLPQEDIITLDFKRGAMSIVEWASYCQDFRSRKGRKKKSIDQPLPKWKRKSATPIV